MEVPATTQTVKMLEQHFTDRIEEHMHPRIEAFTDELMDSDEDINMSTQPSSLLTVEEQVDKDWTSESTNALGLIFDVLTIEDDDSDKEN